MKYLSFCIAGLEEVALKAVSSTLKEKVILNYIEDGLFVYDCNADINKIATLPFVNNSFSVLNTKQNIENENIEKIANSLFEHKTLRKIAKSIRPHEKTFRIMISDEGQLVSIHERSRKRLLNTISRSTELKFSPGRANVEFWVIKRRSKIAFLAKRIGTRTKTERDLQKGELRPELAHLLCYLSETRNEDVFLDPCSGTGSIPLIRAKYPYNMIYACDISENKVLALKNKVKADLQRKNRKRDPFIVLQSDARSLTKFDDGFIDKIVTDPPWGIYDEDNTYSIMFYKNLMEEFIRITKDGSIIILLIGKEDIANNLKDNFKNELRCSLFLNILVAGRKAIIIKWHRIK